MVPEIVGGYDLKAAVLTPVLVLVVSAFAVLIYWIRAVVVAVVVVGRVVVVVSSGVVVEVPSSV